MPSRTFSLPAFLSDMGAVLLLAAIAEFETDLRKERQLERIAKAKEEGRYKGRPATVNGDAIRAALAAGDKPMAVAKRFNVARSTVYRIISETSAQRSAAKHRHHLGRNGASKIYERAGQWLFAVSCGQPLRLQGVIASPALVGVSIIFQYPLNRS